MSYQLALDAEVDPLTAPLRLTLEADGKPHLGAVQSLRALADLRAAAASAASPR
jgi:hypothetical protein